MAKVFSQCNLFPVPCGKHYTLIKILLWIAKSEGPFPNAGCFIYYVLPFAVPEIFLPWNILPVWLENLEREQPMLSFPSSMDQQETKAILVDTGVSSRTALPGLCEERAGFNWDVEVGAPALPQPAGGDASRRTGSCWSLGPRPSRLARLAPVPGANSTCIRSQMI